MCSGWIGVGHGGAIWVVVWGGESFGGEVQFGEKQADFIALLGEAES